MTNTATVEFRQLFPQYIARKEAEETAKERQKSWLAQRHGKFTASSFHKMFTAKYALSQSATATTYVKEKAAETLGAFNEQANSASLRWGNDHEAEAIEAYRNKTGNPVDELRGFVQISEHVGCTPDGFVLNAAFEDTNKIVQIKCPYTVQKHVEYLTYKTAAHLKENSKEYYVQVQFEMYVTGSDFCDFVSYDKRFPEPQQLAVLTVPRDDEMIEKIKDALKLAIQMKATYVTALKSL